MSHGGREGAFSPLPAANERDRKMAKVRICASGFGTQVREFPLVADAQAWMRNDAEEVAVEHNAEVVDFGNGEIVVQRRGSGEEIARWEIEKL